MRFAIPHKSTSVTKTVLFGLALSVLSPACHAFHGATTHAWHRTWYGQDPLNTPLRPYFIPRRPGRCDRDFYGGDYGASGCYQCGNGGVGYGPTMLAAPSAPTMLPLQSERLGQIPNDMGVGGAVPVVAPGR